MRFLEVFLICLAVCSNAMGTPEKVLAPEQSLVEESNMGKDYKTIEAVLKQEPNDINQADRGKIAAVMLPYLETLSKDEKAFNGNYTAYRKEQEITIHLLLDDIVRTIENHLAKIDKKYHQDKQNIIDIREARYKELETAVAQAIAHTKKVSDELIEAEREQIHADSEYAKVKGQQKKLSEDVAKLQEKERVGKLEADRVLKRDLIPVDLQHNESRRMLVEELMFVARIREMVEQMHGGYNHNGGLGPTASPTPAPTKQPTKAPTKAPTPAPTKAPTPAPTTLAPTPAPTKNPTPAPTPSPTPAPTYFYEKRENSHCIGNKFSNTEYPTRLDAIHACDNANGKCGGILSGGCDGKAPFYLCKSPTNLYVYSQKSCIWQRGGLNAFVEKEIRAALYNPGPGRH